MKLKVSKLRILILFLISVLLLGALILASFVACNDKQSPATMPNTPNTPNAPETPTTQAIPQISLVKIASGFSNPTHVTHAGDGSNRLFVVEQQGTIKIVKNGAVLPAPFLDISSRVVSGGERGLFIVVFPSGYGQGKQYFYINYTGNQGGGDTFISRYRTTMNPDVADPASEQILLTIDQPFANHNGGQMAFGRDGYLYIGMGDGGGAGDPFDNAQNTGSLLGKMLRIDVESNPAAANYTVPSNNPFVQNTAYRPEIWALGLRNPWRFSFDRQTGDLYIADVGQGGFEEVDLQPASSSGGENYGWNIMEGAHCYNSASCDQSGLILPVAEYGTHSQGSCSITGGFVYRGQEFSSLQGVYIYGDYCSGRIWGLRQAGGVWENKIILESGLSISTFGEDEAGNIYVADHSAGDIYKIVVPAAP